jgi:hypothetical protein
MGKTFDLLEVVKGVLDSAGIANVFMSLPDARIHPDVVVLGFGLTETETAFYDFDQMETYRISVSVRMNDQAAAERTALAIHDALQIGNFASHNGSYEWDSSTTDLPIPVPWDATGRFIWTVETRIKVIRKEWF